MHLARTAFIKYIIEHEQHDVVYGFNTNKTLGAMSTLHLIHIELFVLRNI